MRTSVCQGECEKRNQFDKSFTVVDELVVDPEAAAALLLLGAVSVEADHKNVCHGNEFFGKPLDVKSAVAAVKWHGQ